MKHKFIRQHEIRAFLRKLNPNVHASPGFVAYFDHHVESALKRAGTIKGTRTLSATEAETACRYPFMIPNPILPFQPS